MTHETNQQPDAGDADQGAVMPAWADPQEVARQAENMGDAALACRDLGHNWKAHTAAWVPGERVYERSLRCTRCRNIRHQILNERGEVISNTYEYRKGYLIKGLGRLSGESRAVLRLEAVQRTIRHVRAAGE